MYYVEEYGKLHKLKDDRKRIGGIDSNHEFKNHIFEANLEITLFYFTTDGFSDQHNQNRTKLGCDYFQKVLRKISNLLLKHKK